MRVLAFVLLAGCSTVNQPIAYTSACGGDEHCQRNRDAETLHYIGQTKAAEELMCPALTEYGLLCAVY